MGFIRGMRAAAAAGIVLATGCAPFRPPLQPPPDLAVLPPGPGAADLVADSAWWTFVPGDAANRLRLREVSWYRVNRRYPPEAESLEVYEDESTEGPPRIRVDALDPGGARWSADPGLITRARARSEGYFSSNQFRHSVRVPGYREGMWIRLEVERGIARPEFRGIEPLAGAHPCLRRFTAFRQPAGYSLSVSISGTGWRSDTAVGRDADGPWREVRFTGAGAGWDGSPFAAGAADAEAPVLRFDAPPRGGRPWGWRDLGDHYLGLLGTEAGDKAVRAAAAKLPGPDPASLADAAFRLVQSRVRYLADEERMHAYLPRPPGRVLAKGYGDCKEMANLMRALLAARGVEARLALVTASGGAGPDAARPSLAGFDHMILAVDAGGERRWYDPTAPAGPAESRLPLLGRAALVLAPGASAFDTVRPAPGYRNRVATTSALGPEGDGHWFLRGSITLKGEAAYAFAQSLRKRPGPSEARAAVRAFLADAFAVQASAWEWSLPAADSAVIGYAMPADALLVSLGDGGVKLDVPSLMGLGPALRGPGARALPAFEQEDFWRLPDGFRQWETRGFDRDGASGAWDSAPGEARRSFKCGALRWGPDERERLEDFLAALSGFTLASGWR